MSLKDLTKNEMGFVLAIFKSPEQDYNTSDIARLLDISAMGALKIARRLEKENILRSKMVGKARVHKLNKENEYVQDYVRFLLKREAEQAPPPIKMWITELRKLTAADAAVLFGSVLRKKDPEEVFPLPAWRSAPGRKKQSSASSTAFRDAGILLAGASADEEPNRRATFQPV